MIEYNLIFKQVLEDFIAKELPIADKEGAKSYGKYTILKVVEYCLAERRKGTERYDDFYIPNDTTTRAAIKEEAEPLLADLFKYSNGVFNSLVFTSTNEADEAHAALVKERNFYQAIFWAVYDRRRSKSKAIREW